MNERKLETTQIVIQAKIDISNQLQSTKTLSKHYLVPIQ